jgi:hypothetical protein
MPASKIMVIRHAEKPSDDGTITGVAQNGDQNPEELIVRGCSVREHLSGSLSLEKVDLPTRGSRRQAPFLRQQQPHTARVFALSTLS